jgi:hypothetical protein
VAQSRNIDQKMETGLAPTQEAELPFEFIESLEGTVKNEIKRGRFFRDSHPCGQKVNKNQVEIVVSVFIHRKYNCIFQFFSDQHEVVILEGLSEDYQSVLFKDKDRI